MNSKVAFLLGTAVGVGIGAAGVSVFLGRRYDEKFNAEIRQIRGKDIPVTTNEEHHEVEPDEESDIDIKKYNADINMKKPDITDYTKNFTNSNPVEVKRTTPPKLRVMTNEDDMNAILRTDFETDVLQYKYYEDEVLTDEEGECVESPIQLVGSDALHELDMGADKVYVHDKTQKTIYEIVRQNCPYSVDLSDEDEDDED